MHWYQWETQLSEIPQKQFIGENLVNYINFRKYPWLFRLQLSEVVPPGARFDTSKVILSFY